MVGDTLLEDFIPGPEGTLAEQFAEVGMSNVADDGSSKLIPFTRLAQATRS